MDFIQNADSTGTLELPCGFITNDYVFQKLHDTLYYNSMLYTKYNSFKSVVNKMIMQ